MDLCLFLLPCNIIVNRFLKITFATGISCLMSCGTEIENSSSLLKTSLKSFAISCGDTINKIDANGLKQGIWYVFKGGPPESITSNHILDSIGYFKDGKKTGYWRQASPNSHEGDSILFANCKPQLDGRQSFEWKPF